MSQTKRRRSSKKRSQSSGAGRKIIITVVALLLLAILYKGVRIGIAAQQSYRNLTNLQTVAENGLVDGDVNAMQLALFNSSQSLNSLDDEIGPLTPILRRLSGVTSIGTTLAHAPELLDVGQAYLAIADQGLAITGPSIASNTGQPILTRLADAASASESDFAALAEQVSAVSSRLETLPLSEMHPAISTRKDQIQAYSALLGPLLQLAPILPELTGTDEPKTYLLLVQNNHELRATGGFITAVGMLQMENAEIAELNFSDSYEIANNSVDHPWAPEPMQKYLGVELMFLRDVNWSPDFPTTAQLARTIYGLDEGVYVDGVVSVDLNAVQTLMGGLGRIRLAGVDQPIDENNIIDQMKLFWQQGASDEETQAKEAVGVGQWWQQRKDFMPILGEAAITRIKNGDVDYVKLADAIQDALAERSIQIWLNDPTAAEYLAELGWDGGVRAKLDSDYLALVDSNFGYNKVDSVMEREIDYTVDWPNGPDGPAEAQVQISYLHGGNAPQDHECDLTPRYGSTYDDMADRCYFNYVRLYVPQGSQLIDVAGVDVETVSTRGGEGNTQMFGAYFVMGPNTQHVVSFRYQLPDSIKADGYNLIVRRQSGTGPIDLALQIADRSEAHIVEEGEFFWQ